MNRCVVGLHYVVGMAFGTGSAVAHRAVDAVMGPRTVQHEVVQSGTPAVAAAAPAGSSVGGSDACGMHTVAFEKVLVIFFYAFCDQHYFLISIVSFGSHSEMH